MKGDELVCGDLADEQILKVLKKAVEAIESGRTCTLLLGFIERADNGVIHAHQCRHGERFDLHALHSMLRDCLP